MSPSQCWRTEAEGCQRGSVHPPAIPRLASAELHAKWVRYPRVFAFCLLSASRGEGTTAEKKAAVPWSPDWSSSPRERKPIRDLQEAGLPLPLPSASALSHTQNTPEGLTPSHVAPSERRPSPRIPAELRASRKVTNPAPPRVSIPDSSSDLSCHGSLFLPPPSSLQRKLRIFEPTHKNDDFSLMSPKFRKTKPKAKASQDDISHILGGPSGRKVGVTLKERRESQPRIYDMAINAFRLQDGIL